ncbi:Ribosomal protein L11 methyltransferase [Pseudodesulfovibrio profundus]|uniref:Ribosomal protein L11 methyltransferase n=1 Tax=Pseudodesulfovibrio profundus TaxID=57320 RepID=A0A2C8F435_9BACT|nr:50S ribosomal protein L11 methyltransferase [Pseudodesulfovibrio profundus]SOB57258.1 Ribosomal protein L11 methyltransferase [Pseudodesulfovibrio profundus]
MSTLLKIEFTIPEEMADEAGLFISSKVPHGWEETPVDNGRHMTMYLEDHPLGMEIVSEFKKEFPTVEVKHSEQESEDWAMAWKDFFNPVNCGETFRILPPWLENGEDDNTTHIVIEPKMAFGTGHHPTTALCLETIGALAQKDIIKTNQTFLDLGTGSGILGIGMCKLGLQGTGLDIDPQAIVCAVENVQKNHVDQNIDLAVGSIECLEKSQLFDVVVANILSGPLIEMARDIISHVKPGGVLILSGILAGNQADTVADVYERQGIGKPERYVQGEWECLVWEQVGE